MAKEFSTSFKRGDTQTIRFGVLLEDNEIIQLGANDEIYFTLRTGSGQLVFQKKYSNNTLRYEDGNVLVDSTHEDTNELKPATYKYDIQVNLSGTELVKTPWEGEIELEDDQTRE